MAASLPQQSTNPRLTIPAPSRDAVTLSWLVAAVYDAAIDPTIWPTVLRASSAYVGGISASLFAKTLSGMAGGIYHDDGAMADAYKLSYFERYCHLDPCNASHIFAELEQPVSLADFFDVEEFRESRFYREWAEPQGLVDFISAPIEKQGQWAAMFGVFRHARDGMVDDATRHRMRLLAPHIRRAVLIGKVIEAGAGQAASFGATLDGLAAGLVLLDANGQIVHRNAAADDLLRAANAVASRAGRFVAVDRAAAAALDEACEAAASGDERLGARGISVPLPSRDGEPWVAHVLPLTSGARRSTGNQYAAKVAIFVQQATVHIPASAEVIAKAFGLTLGELRVLLTIVQAGGVSQTAAALGVAETTVKTHLGRVFAKTGTSRQADLVRLMAGFASPLSR